MSAIYNDNTVQYGSIVLSINSVNYVADSFSVQRPTNALERRNELNEPNEQVLIRNFETGSAVLQYASGDTPDPALGKTFTVTLNTVIVAETFIVSEVSTPLEQGGEKKIHVSFRKKQGS